MRGPTTDRIPAVNDTATPRPNSVAWLLFAVTVLAFVITVLSTMHTGVARDPRIGIQGAPTPKTSRFLAPAPFMVGSLLQTIVLFAVLLRMSYRQRRLHWAAVIAIGAFFTGLVDPLANWATFASLSPAVPHLPASWPWVRLAPLAEPASAFLGGYSSYYLLIGLGAYWATERLQARSDVLSGWRARHPNAAVFVGAWILSFPVNGLLQLGWMKMGMLLYTQFAGPVIVVGELHLPLLILFYDPFVYATVALLCRRDRAGNPAVLESLARILPGRRRPSSTSGSRQVLVAGTLLLTSILLPVSVFSLIRTLGLANHVTYSRYPYTNAKVYDPYGTLRGAGRPGPYVR